MENFDIVKYLKENHLGPHSILGGYVDLHALKEVEDMEGWEMVKDFGAIKDKLVADKYAEVERTGNDDLDVKVVNKDGVYKVYTRAKKELNKEAEDLKGIETSDLKIGDIVKYEGTEYKIGGFDTAGGANLVYLDTMNGKPAEDSKGGYKKVHKSRVKKLNKEADYGNNEPVDEVPYVGAQKKLDGFGDEFDQVAPVEEIQMAGENPWLNDSIDGEMIGDWTAYFAGQMGTIYLVHPLLKDLTVYATPGWEGEEGIAIAVVEDDVDKPWKNGIVPGSTNSYETFEEYAADMQSVLKDIENAYMDNSVTGDPGWEYTDKDFPIAEEEGMNDDDSENPFPSIIDDETANMSHDDKFAYMGGSDIEKAVKSLMANNFKGIEIARFVVDTIGKFKK